VHAQFAREWRAWLERSGMRVERVEEVERDSYDFASLRACCAIIVARKTQL